MVHGFVDVLNDPDGEDGSQIFGIPIVIGCREHIGDDGPAFFTAAEFHAVIAEGGGERRQDPMFFKYRNTALRRLERLAEEENILTEMQYARLTYAKSEMHIVSSTYYFYYGQAEQAITEINKTYLDPSLPTDTAQWLYYRYMLGSGGLLKGQEKDVVLY